MAFNHIALNQRGMTRIESFGYVVFYFDVYEFLAGDVLLFDFKPIRLQVPDPRGTASSAGILIDRYRCCRGFRLRIAHRAAHGQEEKDTDIPQAETVPQTHYLLLTYRRNASNYQIAWMRQAIYADAR